MKTKLQVLSLVLGLHLLAPAFAAPNNAPRYFEGELRIEQSVGGKNCQQLNGKITEAQVSWQDTGQGRIGGWIIFAGGAPGKLEGATPAKLTITTNHHDAQLNTPMVLSLDIADGKATGVLQETPAKPGFSETMCYWQQAKLTLTEKNTDAAKRMREHAAWYKAYAHKSRGETHARYAQFAEAAAAYDQAFAEVEGVLPETRTDLYDLLFSAARYHAEAKNYALAAQRFQQLMDIGLRQSEKGAENPDLYRSWLRLATYLHLADRTTEAIPVIERTARLESQAEDVSLEERLLRLRLQGNIYITAKMFDKAQTSLQEEITLASAKAGPDSPLAYEARVQWARGLKAMNDPARFEATLEPLAKEITTRFGEAHELARDSNALLGWHYLNTGRMEKSRPWLESAFRGHRALTGNALTTIKANEPARNILGTLLEIYIKQGIVPADYLDRFAANQDILDDLPYNEGLKASLNLPAFKIGAGE